jgi:hypothetical protein
MNNIVDKLNIEEFNNISISGLTNQLTSFCVDKIYKNSKRNIKNK